MNPDDSQDDTAWKRLTDAICGPLDDPPTTSGSRRLDVLSAHRMHAVYRHNRCTRAMTFTTALGMLVGMPLLDTPVLFLPCLALFGVTAWLTQTHDLSRARGRRLAALVIEAERMDAGDARITGKGGR